MPTATGFSWSFPWSQVVGGFNAFIQMLNTPIAMSVALILVLLVGVFVVNTIQGILKNWIYRDEWLQEHDYSSADDFRSDVAIHWPDADSEWISNLARFGSPVEDLDEVYDAIYGEEADVDEEDY